MNVRPTVEPGALPSRAEMLVLECSAGIVGEGFRPTCYNIAERLNISSVTVWEHWCRMRSAGTMHTDAPIPTNSGWKVIRERFRLVPLEPSPDVSRGT